MRRASPGANVISWTRTAIGCAWPHGAPDHTSPRVAQNSACSQPLPLDQLSNLLSLRNCRWGSGRLQLAPAAGAVVMHDLLEHGGQGRRVDRLPLIEGDHPGRLVLVPAR